MHIGIFVIVIGCVFFILFRRSYLFAITIKNGKAAVLRGAVPAGLLSEFRRVLKNIEYGEVRAHRTSEGARLSFRGSFDDFTSQRLRNIFGMYPIARLNSRSTATQEEFTEHIILSKMVSWFRHRVYF